MHAPQYAFYTYYNRVMDNQYYGDEIMLKQQYNVSEEDLFKLLLNSQNLLLMDVIGHGTVPLSN